ncbi:MAG: HAMP domain-containing protein [Deltaproteobacteria bacterium]|nr:HAMP domain-containing protein [Deltaproteobacteria bacterium]
MTGDATEHGLDRQPQRGTRVSRGLSVGLKLGFIAAAATSVVLAGMAYLTIRFFHDQLLRVITEAGMTESDALRIVLEEQMMAGDRKLLKRLISDVGKESGIAWIGVVDKEGRVQVSSAGELEGHKFKVSAPECNACHASAPAQRLRSTALVRPDGGVLRTVTPMINREQCHRCHGSDHRLNGVLIIDRTLNPVQAAIATSRTQVIVGSAAALFALLASVGFAVERMVLRRLRRLRQATRQLGQGDPAARAGDEGKDELGGLARDFNDMAGRLDTAMATLAAEKTRLEGILNGIADGVVLVDARMLVVAMNRALAALLPEGTWPAPAVDYRRLRREAGIEEAATGQAPAERALSGGRLEKEIVKLRRPAGGGAEPPATERAVEIYAQPVRLDGGSAAAVIEVWRDVTDRLALEVGLGQSERLASLGMLASSVAHEVGNPLASIAAAVEGLLCRIDSTDGVRSDELREYLEIVRTQVFRCHGVNQRLLSFARASSSDLTVVDAAKTVRDVLALVAHQARSQKVEVKADIAGPAPAAAEDMMLDMVVLNLVLNALKVMPSGGVLSVAVQNVPDGVMVEVADTGPGIPETMKQHLFKPFRSARQDGGGTGLGLFLSQNLVRRCGGQIAVRSEPGKGAAFTVRLRRSTLPIGPGGAP